MRLDRLPPAKLRKYAAIVHDLFDSYDLAQAVLVEHDRQTGQNLAERYARRFSITYATNYAAMVEHGRPPDNPRTVRRCDAAVESVAGHIYSAPANCCPASSTYALLEQERWFEIETNFVGRISRPRHDRRRHRRQYRALLRAHGHGGRPSMDAFSPTNRAATDNRRHLERNIELNRLGQRRHFILCAFNYAERACRKRADPANFDSIVASGTDSAATDRSVAKSPRWTPRWTARMDVDRLRQDRCRRPGSPDRRRWAQVPWRAVATADV